MTGDELAATITPRLDWRMAGMVILACVVAALVGFTTPYTIAGSNTAGDIQTSTEIQGCRSQANAEVTDARNDVDQLRITNDILQNEFNNAIVNSDLPALVALQPRFEPTRKALLAAGVTLDRTNAAYQEAVRMSREDPEEFLRRCDDPAPVATTTTSTIPATTTPQTAPPASVPTSKVGRRVTTTTRPTSTTGSTTSTTVYRTPPTTTAPPCVGLFPIPLPKEIPCI